MKKYLILTGIFIAFHIVMFFTNPYKDLHVQKITSTIHFIEKENSAMTLDLMNELFLDSYIFHEVSYHKYWFISRATYDQDNETTIKTIGVFGNVYLI